MSGTNVPSVQFTPTGLVIPTEAENLAGIQADQNAAFGGNLNPGLTTPQGQLATSQAAAKSNADSVFAQFVDQVDPDNAEGFMQDAIGRIYFLNRNPALPTVVQLVCGGDVGVSIPVGAQAKDTSGNIYVCTQAGKIAAGGTVTLSFANIVTGPIPCPENTVTSIYQSIPGWDTVNNPSAGTVGQDVETQAAFEFRRQQTVAANAHGSLPAIYGNVFEVEGVLDVFAVENVTDNPISGAIMGNPNVTNYTVVGHSFYIAVTGGAAADIAEAIFEKKNEGSNMNGNTSFNITDTSYSYPQPVYTYTWNVPTPTQYAFIVNILNSSALPSTIVQDVQNAMTAQFNGVTGVAQANGIVPATTGQRARIGSLLLAATFYGPVATCEGPTVPVQVLSILIGSVCSATGSVSDTSNVLTITAVASGSLTPGTTVTDADSHIPAGTTIVQQLTGTAGGVGTYQMSAAATGTASGEAITGAGSTAQQIGIDQQPQIGTIVVNLIG